MFSPPQRKKVIPMNRFIYFDNLRSAAVVLTLAALLLQPWQAFYEESAVIAISIIFFISAYLGASALRIRTISFFLKDKWKRLGWPGLVLLLLGVEEQLVTANLPVTSWVLLWLFLLFSGLALMKHINHNVLQHRVASKPSVPFLLAFIIISAAVLFFCQAFLPQSLRIPYIAQVRPDWLVLSFFAFSLGVYAFRHRWFTPSGYQPKVHGLLGFAIMVGVYAAWMPGKGATILTALTPTLLLIASVLGLSACFRQQFNTHTSWSHTLHRISYGLFFVSEPIVIHSMWFLQPLSVALWLKIVITALILAIYGYLLCRYALLHIPCFKSKG